LIRQATKAVSTFIFLIAIISCSTQKSATKNAEEMKTLTIINNSLKQKPVFTDLTIQAKIQAEIDGNSIGLNGKIYIQNEKKIWVNVSKFGINAARALITPTGFKAYEKLDRTYIDGDFTYFNNLLKVDFIDYQTLQNLLLGRIFTEMKPADFQSEILNNEYVLTYKDNENLMSNPKEGKYIQTYTFGNDYLLRKAVIKDPDSKMELQIDYSNWLKVGIQPFPKNVKVLVKDKKTQKVELEYNNFTFEQSETPFEIPSGYKPNKLFK
jgi:hypothetical protein